VHLLLVACIHTSPCVHPCLFAVCIPTSLSHTSPPSHRLHPHLLITCIHASSPCAPTFFHCAHPSMPFHHLHPCLLTMCTHIFSLCTSIHAFSLHAPTPFRHMHPCLLAMCTHIFSLCASIHVFSLCASTLIPSKSFPLVTCRMYAPRVPSPLTF
jgi:hypothetical protein